MDGIWCFDINLVTGSIYDCGIVNQQMGLDKGNIKEHVDAISFENTYKEKNNIVSDCPMRCRCIYYIYSFRK